MIRNVKFTRFIRYTVIVSFLAIHIESLGINDTIKPFYINRYVPKGLGRTGMSFYGKSSIKAFQRARMAISIYG